MFGMKTKKEKLETKYQKLLEEAYKLSHSNRSKSDEKDGRGRRAEKTNRRDGLS